MPWKKFGQGGRSMVALFGNRYLFQRLEDIGGMDSISEMTYKCNAVLSLLARSQSPSNSTSSLFRTENTMVTDMLMKNTIETATAPLKAPNLYPVLYRAMLPWVSCFLSAYDASSDSPARVE